MSGPKNITLDMVVGHIGDYTDDAILITEAEPCDRPGPRILWANKAFCRMTGYDLEEIVGQTPRILQGEDTDKTALSQIREALKAWKRVRVELKNYRKDGTPFYVDLGIQPVTDSEGWHHYWIAIQRETTQRYERDQLLRRTTQIIDSAPIALGLLSVGNRLTFANRHFQRLLFRDRMLPALPLPYESWLRRAVGDAEDAATSGPIGRDWMRRHLGGLFSTPARVEQKVDGRWHEFRCVATTSGDQLIIGEDIEDRIQLQEQLRHMTKLDAMGQLTSGVAHDFNNILAVILGNVELLQMEEVAEADRDQFISEAVAAVLKGRALTHSLLSFARKSHMAPTICSVALLCRETVGMFRRTSASRVEVIVEAAQDIPDIHVDPNMFQNALLNILINARDAMPRGGEIRIILRVVADPQVSGRTADGTDLDCVEIDIHDQGDGMQPQTLQQAIEPFFTTKDAGAGSGLGLSMVHGFVEQSGGALLLTSEPGVGTQVRMRFPAEARAREVETQITSGGTLLDGIRILLAEDEGALRRLFTRTLETAGAIVTAVETGDGAVALSDRWAEFDLLITDIVMPGVVQGDMLARQFSDRCPQSPVILLSGNPEVMNSVRPSGSARSIVHSKPIQRNVLIEQIAAMVGKPQS
jgi:PAS domain S-box-containing protein